MGMQARGLATDCMDCADGTDSALHRSAPTTVARRLSDGFTRRKSRLPRFDSVDRKPSVIPIARTWVGCSTSPYDSDFPFGYIRSMNRLAASVFSSSVFDTRQRLVTSTSSTSIILLVTGCLSNFPVTPSDAKTISSRITILWFRYCVSMGFMTPFYR